MQQYIGVKRINGIPMTRLAYNQLRNWDLPADENGEDKGYLVEYLDGGQANVPGYAGYVSWSPKQIFEDAYRPTTGLSFGLAIEAAKLGSKIARAGWNDKDMWVAYTPGSTFDIQHAKPGHAVKHRANELKDGDQITLLPHFDMRASDGSMVIGWLAYQTDMLADDWQIVE